MIVGGGKRKGTQFERKIAKELSLWWSDDKRDDIFWLTSGSGARATKRAKKGVKTKYQYGDLSVSDPLGKSFIDYFLIELKSGYPKLGVLSLIDGKQKNPLFIRWWMKAEEECKFGKRNAAILIIKRNHKQPIIVFDSVVFSKVELYVGTWKKNLLVVYLTAIEKELVIVPLFSFLEYCSSESMQLFIDA